MTRAIPIDTMRLARELTDMLAGCYEPHERPRILKILYEGLLEDHRNFERENEKSYRERGNGRER